MSQAKRKTAIVVGGSMGGLLAASALAGHFEHVTIIDRDQFPAIGEHRRGVPQSRHTHGLLASGARVLDDFFPGFCRQLLEAGAVPCDITADGRWFHEGGYLRQFKSGLDGTLISRPLLEGMVRKRVLALANVDAITYAEVAALIADQTRQRVTGVQLTDGKVIEADLVVNATGRGSHGSAWLEALGYAKPAVDRVEVSLGYATRQFRRNRRELNGDTVVVIPPTPHFPKGGVMLAQEGDRWTVTLIAHFSDYAPSDLEGFRNFAKNLPSPDIYEVIGNAEPIGDPYTARFPASIRHRYERLSRFPFGYLVFGDAICNFNPIYGQGMSVAALQAVVLQKCLGSNSPDLAARFFAEAAKAVDIPWSIAVGNDLRMPRTIGPRTPAVRLINWYMAKLHQAAHHDAELSLAFQKVANLLAPPPSVMHPRLVWRVLKGNLSHPSATGLRARALAANS